MEAIKWGAHWLCDAEYALPWPEDLGAALPAVDPGAWLRCGAATLLSLITLFALVEKNGR